MIDLRAEDLDSRQRYSLLTGIVVPRPIAWVSTLGAGGAINVAPFSCYMFVCGDPATIAISIGSRATGYKDTLRNIERSGEYVVNAVGAGDLASMAESSRPFASHVSEAEQLGLETTPSLCIKAPRIASAPASMECVLERLVPINDRNQHNLVLGRVLCFHLRDDLWANGRFASENLEPVGRLGGPVYAGLGTRIRIDLGESPLSAESHS